MSFETKKFNKIEVNTFYLGNIPQKRIQIHWRKSTVFKNHRKSLIQHCERSELGLHFKWTKVDQKCSILASFLETYGQTVLPDKSLFKGQKLVENGQFLKNLWSNSVIRQVTFNWTKIDGKYQNQKIQMRHFEWFSNIV